MADEETPSSSSGGGGVSGEDKAFGAIAYLGILFIVPLLAKKDSEFCMFHAKQGLVLFIIDVVGGIIFWIPFVGWALLTLVGILSLVALINALMGNKWKIPVIGDLAEKFKF
jgi:uncharacterized membrane protein